MIAPFSKQSLLTRQSIISLEIGLKDEYKAEKGSNTGFSSTMSCMDECRPSSSMRFSPSTISVSVRVYFVQRPVSAVVRIAQLNGSSPKKVEWHLPSSKYLHISRKYNQELHDHADSTLENGLGRYIFIPFYV